MLSFQIIVLSIATIILILVLTMVGIIMRKASSDVKYPPVSNNCPEYWVTDGNFCKLSSTNTGNLITIPTDTPGYSNDKSGFDYTSPYWAGNGLTSTCGKKEWAVKHNIVWDGISNYNSCA